MIDFSVHNIIYRYLIIVKYIIYKVCGYTKLKSYYKKNEYLSVKAKVKKGCWLI